MKRKATIRVEPDEIFIDATNLPLFNAGRFEGRIEAPLSTRAQAGIGIVLICLLLIAGTRLFFLQIVHGEEYKATAESNRINRDPVFAERGIIYDRNGEELAWNVPFANASSTAAIAPVSDNIPSDRAYNKRSGMAHIVGYVTLPRRDTSGVLYRSSIEGVTGVEKSLNGTLSGINGARIEEADAHGATLSKTMLVPPKSGKPITLSIDAAVTEALAMAIHEASEKSGFVGGAGVIVNVKNGEIIALTSYPEYDSRMLSAATNTSAITNLQQSARSPFLNRVIAGRYTPGSIIKPFVAVAALAEGVITPEKKIESTGVLRVANPFTPGMFSTFIDWRAHGNVDMRRALAISSNIYFYEVGGGYKNQKGVGIANIEKYARRFGIGNRSNIALAGEVEGVIPNPAWKLATFNDVWRLGDTYHTAIGQYGFLVTPLSMALATAAMANGGELLTPSLELGTAKKSTAIAGINAEHFQVVREGMRASVTEGTAAALNISDIKIAGKTGTAQVGARNELVHSWVIGFYPYDEPLYAFALLLERAPAGPPMGAPATMRRFFDLLKEHAPLYLESLKGEAEESVNDE